MKIKKEMHEKLSVYSVAIALVVLPASSSRNESCVGLASFAFIAVNRNKRNEC